MLQIWAKIMKNHKIKKDLIYSSPDPCTCETEFAAHIAQLCHTLDIPTPVVLKSNFSNFDSFNNTRFKAGDFVEYVDFDCLHLENAKSPDDRPRRPSVHDEE